MTLNVKVLSFSNALNPLSWSVYFMVYISSAKHPEQGTIIELFFKKGVKCNLFVKISHKRCDSDKGA